MLFTTYFTDLSSSAILDKRTISDSKEKLNYFRIKHITDSTPIENGLFNTTQQQEYLASESQDSDSSTNASQNIPKILFNSADIKSNRTFHDLLKNVVPKSLDGGHRILSEPSTAQHKTVSLESFTDSNLSDSSNREPHRLEFLFLKA